MTTWGHCGCSGDNLGALLELRRQPGALLVLRMTTWGALLVLRMTVDSNLLQK